MDKIEMMINILKSLFNDPRIKLLMKANECLREKLDLENMELGCVDAMNEIHRRAFGEKIADTSSTIQLEQALNKNDSFVIVQIPAPGDIILSVTGTGNGNVAHGHVGVVLTSGYVASNSSLNGRWSKNYTVKNWKERYSNYGGFKLVYYRKID